MPRIAVRYVVGPSAAPGPGWSLSSTPPRTAVPTTCGTPNQVDSTCSARINRERAEWQFGAAAPRGPEMERRPGVKAPREPALVTGECRLTYQVNPLSARGRRLQLIGVSAHPRSLASAPHRLRRARPRGLSSARRPPNQGRAERGQAKTWVRAQGCPFGIRSVSISASSDRELIPSLRYAAVRWTSTTPQSDAARGRRRRFSVRTVLRRIVESAPVSISPRPRTCSDVAPRGRCRAAAAVSRVASLARPR